MAYNIIVGRDDDALKKYGEKGVIFLGKSYVKMGQNTSLSNNIYLDIVRAHVILVAGKRGCLTEDTMIFTDKGYKKIDNFDEKIDKILSFNKESKEFEWENAELLEYPIKNENLIEIEFNDGRKIILTREHPLLASYGKYIFWRRACDLKVNDKIISPTKIPPICEEDRESLRIARLLGFILSDGTINVRKGIFKDGRGCPYNGTKARIRIYNNSNGVLERAKKDIEEEFGVNAKRYKRNDCNCEVIETKHQKIVNKMMELGIPKGHKAGIIRVPRIVFESSNKFKAEFINALFSCDGYIPKGGNCLDYSSKSKGFLIDMQLLLSHFNIQSVIRIKNAKLNGIIYPNYRLFITDNTSVENFKKIGFIHEEKQKRLESFSREILARKKKTCYHTDELVCLKIKSLKEVYGIKKVYDLSVNKNHSFIANGIISHNSGKSFTLGVIAEELANLPSEIAQNLSVLIFDTMGIFWTMKYANQKEKDLLDEWQLPSKGLNVNIFTPKGYFNDYQKKGIAVDFPFTIKTNELTASDWCGVFGVGLMDDVGVAIERALSALEGKEYDIEDIIYAVHSLNVIEKNVKMAVENRLRAAQRWGVFEKNGTEIRDLFKRGEVSILDISCYSEGAGSWSVKSLVVGLVCKRLFADRMVARKIEEMKDIERGREYFTYEEESFKEEMPLAWILIDEAQEFLPKDKEVPSSYALMQLLREGRQPGIAMVLATQQPGEIHGDVMTQSDLVISHSITAKKDIEALNAMMQTYLTNDILSYLNDLPDEKGAAVILDDNSERLYPMRVRPRFTWHGGEAPSALRVKRKELLELGL